MSKVKSIGWMLSIGGLASCSSDSIGRHSKVELVAKNYFDKGNEYRDLILETAKGGSQFLYVGTWEDEKDD